MQSQDLEKLLTMASDGWKVFPCHSINDGKCTCSKGSACKSQGKHPRTIRGVKDASSDHSVIKQWDKTWPDANWGLACGDDSGVVVIDIDRAHGGFETAEELDRNVPNAMVDTLRVLTGGGGRHLYYRYPENYTIKNRVGWMPGIDVRSIGGYVILPPSGHISGGTYRWDPRSSPLADMTADLRDLLMAPSAPGGKTGPAISDLSTLLSGVPEGSRDQTLFLAACRIRRQHEGDSDGGRAAVELMVYKMAELSDFPRDEAEKCINQAFKQDHTDKISYMDSKDLRPLDEQGCADRFIDLCGEDLRFTPAIGWLQWTDRGWQVVEDYVIRDRLMVVGDILLEEMAQASGKELLKEYRTWYGRVRSSAGNKALYSLVEQSPRVVREMVEFDSDSHSLACENGMVDLRTGQLRAYTRDDLVTKNTGVRYSPSARSQVWEDFLGVSTQGDAELIEYLQLAAGYTATGGTTDESFFIISGPGASGKSTYMDAIQTALGSYSITIPSHVIMRRRGQVPETDLARMAGARMVSVAEINEGDYFNDSLVKQVVTGDRTTARFLYKRAFDFIPQLKLWIATNHEPMSSDPALMRRMKRIAFNHSVPQSDRDPMVKAALKTTEAEAVLAWVVAGAKKFYALDTGRLVEPLAIEEAIAEYRADQDILGMFIDTSIQKSPGSTPSRVEVYRNYVAWCDPLQMRPEKLPVFEKQMADRGYKIFRLDNGAKVYSGFIVMVANVGSLPWA